QRNAGPRHVPQNGNQSRNSRVTSPNNDYPEVLVPGYVKWQKGQSLFRNCSVGTYIFSGFSITRYGACHKARLFSAGRVIRRGRGAISSVLQLRKTTIIPF